MLMRGSPVGPGPTRRAQSVPGRLPTLLSGAERISHGDLPLMGVDHPCLLRWVRMVAEPLAGQHFASQDFESYD
jgi:hypothetical protein